jgi:hypothetical protein
MATRAAVSASAVAAADAAAPLAAPRALRLLDLPDELLLNIMTRRVRAHDLALTPPPARRSCADAGTFFAAVLRDALRLADQPFPAAALPGYAGVDPRPDGARTPAPALHTCARTHACAKPWSHTFLYGLRRALEPGRLRDVHAAGVPPPARGGLLAGAVFQP